MVQRAGNAPNAHLLRVQSDDCGCLRVDIHQDSVISFSRVLRLKLSPSIHLHPPHLRSVLQSPAQELCQLGTTAGREENPGLSMSHNLRHAAMIGSNYGYTSGESLDQYQRKALEPHGWKCEQHGSAHEIENIAAGQEAEPC